MISDTMPEEKNSVILERTMEAMIAFGIGEVLGGLFMGFVIDSKGPKIVVIINVVILVLMTVVTIFFLVFYTYSMLAFVMTFLWGF